MRSAEEFMDDFMTKLKNGEFDRLRGIFPEKKKYASYTLESYINWRDEQVDDIIAEEGLFRKGVNRKYQNPDGSLKDEAIKYEDAFNNAEELRKAMLKEADALISKNKQLSYDFGGTASNIDDWDAFDLQLQEYKINGNDFYKARKAYDYFVSKNKDAIKTGRYLVDHKIATESSHALLKKQLELKAVASGQMSAAVRNAEKLMSKANSVDEIDHVIEICDKNIRLCQRRLNGKLPDKSLMFKDKTVMQKGLNEFTRVRGKAVAKRKSLA